MVLQRGDRRTSRQLKQIPAVHEDASCYVVVRML
jgi:hypothetical protein